MHDVAPCLTPACSACNCMKACTAKCTIQPWCQFKQALATSELQDLELKELQLRSSCQTYHHGQHVGIFRCFSMALAAQPEYAIDVLQTAFMIFNLVHADIRVSVSSNIGLQSPNVLYWLCCVHVCIWKRGATKLQIEGSVYIYIYGSFSFGLSYENPCIRKRSK